MSFWVSQRLSNHIRCSRSSISDLLPARALGEWAIGSVAVFVHVDDAFLSLGCEFEHAVKSETLSFQRAIAVALDENIDIGDESVEYSSIVGLGDIEVYRALASVEGKL